MIFLELSGHHAGNETQNWTNLVCGLQTKQLPEFDLIQAVLKAIGSCQVILSNSAEVSPPHQLCKLQRENPRDLQPSPASKVLQPKESICLRANTWHFLEIVNRNMHDKAQARSG